MQRFNSNFIREKLPEVAEKQFFGENHKIRIFGIFYVWGNPGKNQNTDGLHHKHNGGEGAGGPHGAELGGVGRDGPEHPAKQLRHAVRESTCLGEINFILN